MGPAAQPVQQSVSSRSVKDCFTGRWRAGGDAGRPRAGENVFQDGVNGSQPPVTPAPGDLTPRASRAPARVWTHPPTLCSSREASSVTQVSSFLELGERKALFPVVSPWRLVAGSPEDNGTCKYSEGLGEAIFIYAGRSYQAEHFDLRQPQRLGIVTLSPGVRPHRGTSGSISGTFGSLRALQLGSIQGLVLFLPGCLP